MQRQHERGLDLPGVGAKAVFVGTEALRQVVAVGVHQRQLVPIDAIDSQPQTHPQVAPHDVHEAGLPAVGVEQHQLAHTAGSSAFGHVGPQAQHGFGFERERAAKAAVLGAIAHRQGGQKQGGGSGRQGGDGGMHQTIGDGAVHLQRQMRAMLLGSPDG